METLDVAAKVFNQPRIVCALFMARGGGGFWRSSVWKVSK